MMKRRKAIATLVASCMSVPAAVAQTQGVHVMDSAPKAHAQIGQRSSEFFVRFDRPVIDATMPYGVEFPEVSEVPGWREFDLPEIAIRKKS